MKIMAQLQLVCWNCGTPYAYTTPYETHVGNVGEVQIGTNTKLYPTCPYCTSPACKVVGQS